MQAFIALVRRELGSFFKSWTGYVIIAGAMFLVGFSFWSMLEAFKSDPQPTSASATQLFFETLYFWYVVLIVTPLITMRTFAQEKSSGTYETLMTTPVGDGQVVLAKFTGAMLFYLVLWMPLLACVGIVRYYSNDHSALDPSAVTTTYLGILLVGSVYLSMGIFTSAITKSQIIAAMVSFAVGFTMLMLSSLAPTFATQTSWTAQFIAHVSLVEHMRDFAQGIVDSRPVVLYFTLTSFFLFLSWKSVESRRWK